MSIPGMTPEEFERVRNEWKSRETTTLPKLRCFYCLTDLTDIAALYDPRIEAAVCMDHSRPNHLDPEDEITD